MQSSAGVKIRILWSRMTIYYTSTCSVYKHCKCYVALTNLTSIYWFALACLHEWKTCHGIERRLCINSVSEYGFLKKWRLKYDCATWQRDHTSGIALLAEIKALCTGNGFMVVSPEFIKCNTVDDFDFHKILKIAVHIISKFILHCLLRYLENGESFNSLYDP